MGHPEAWGKLLTIRMQKDTYAIADELAKSVHMSMSEFMETLTADAVLSCKGKVLKTAAKLKKAGGGSRDGD